MKTDKSALNRVLCALHGSLIFGAILGASFPRMTEFLEDLCSGCFTFSLGRRRDQD